MLGFERKILIRSDETEALRCFSKDIADLSVATMSLVAAYHQDLTLETRQLDCRKVGEQQICDLIWCFDERRSSSITADFDGKDKTCNTLFDLDSARHVAMVLDLLH